MATAIYQIAAGQRASCCCSKEVCRIEYLLIPHKKSQWGVLLSLEPPTCLSIAVLYLPLGRPSSASAKDRYSSSLLGAYSNFMAPSFVPSLAVHMFPAVSSVQLVCVHLLPESSSQDRIVLTRNHQLDTLYELTCKDVRLNYFMAFAEPPLPLS